MKLNTTRYTVKSEKLPTEYDGYKIAVLSDLHDTVYGENNGQLLERIHKENPDLIIIAGDLVTAKSGRDFSPAYYLLKELAKHWQVYYAVGNHEQRLMNPDFCEKNKINDKYWQNVEKLKGITILDNETVILDRRSFGDGVISQNDNVTVSEDFKPQQYEIRIAGLTLPKKFYTKGKSIKLTVEDITTAIADKKDVFTILIAHNPIYFREYAKWGADLVFSGHLHGGIVRLPFIGGVASPQMRLFPKYDKGMFKIEDSTMIVSAGLGMHTIPIRLWNPTELLMVELKKDDR